MEGLLSPLRRAYLAVYNWSVFFGWFQVLYFALKTLKESSHEQVYHAVERPLQLTQTAAVLEILHILVGMVRSPLTATVQQTCARLYILWGILWTFPAVRTSSLASILVLIWSITEMIRCSFFGVKEALGFAPYWLLWLRYSSFLLLFPIGAATEVVLIYITLPFMKESENYSLWMANKWNFSLYYFYAAIITLGTFIPGSCFMFRYMVRNRKKALSKLKTV